MTKGMVAMLVYTTKKCSYNSIVIVDQHGSYDVTCKPRIAIDCLFASVCVFLGVNVRVYFILLLYASK